MNPGKINNWRREKVIERGLVADVYEVVTEGGSTCIGKFIRLPGSQGEADVKAQLDDCIEKQKHLLDLNHSNLVKVLDIKPLYDQGMVAVFMEKVDGKSLAKILAEKGTLKEGDIKRYVGQMCSALDHLHNLDNNVIHRNICSDTVIITKENNVKLGDYGMSIQLLGATSIQSSGSVRGLPQYMAPELLNATGLEGPDGTRYSRDSDIWALGCVIYEMATGKKPHSDCRNMLAIGRRVQKDGAPSLPDSCSPDLKSFYSACVAMERRERESAAVLLGHNFLK